VRHSIPSLEGEKTPQLPRLENAAAVGNREFSSKSFDWVILEIDVAIFRNNLVAGAVENFGTGVEAADDDPSGGGQSSIKTSRSDRKSLSLGRSFHTSPARHVRIEPTVGADVAIGHLEGPIEPCRRCCPARPDRPKGGRPPAPGAPPVA
jgi:hypothetical protein